jgi:hypothetical protein
MGFRLSGSLSHEPFLSFSTMGLRLSRSLSHELFSFFTMEFWLSRSLFSRTFPFFHDGILAIRKPFFTNFSLFSRWNSGYHEAFFHELFPFFTMEFSKHKIRNMQFGGRLFSYIYRKEYLHGIRLVKNLASWFRAPFCKEKSTVLLILELRLRHETNFSEVTYRHATRAFIFLQYKLTKIEKLLSTTLMYN